jgi:predicted RNA binding protein YcfA (HicA-like mRNA interferase family)
MGRLAGFSYQDVARKMRRLGFEFYRSAKGDHEVWIHPVTNLRATIPHHRQIREGTLRNILKQAQIKVDDFLNA